MSDAGDSLKATIDDVRAAYRLLLGREPDAHGLAHYQAQVDYGLPVGELVRTFMGSPEYRARVETNPAIVDVDCGDYFVQVRAAEDDFGWKIARHHTWEPHIVANLRKLLAASDTFVDIGANVGVMAFAAARCVGPGGRVIAIEPNHENLQRLYGGIVRNGFTQVRVVPFAASDRATIFALAGGSSNTHVVDAASGREYIQAVVLDELLAELGRLDAVKLDIEGHEPFALRGFARTLRRFRPRVLLEYNPRCLKDHAHLDPRAVADEVFAIMEDVHRVQHDGSLVAVANAAALWADWIEGNRQMVASGQLPDGMLHFDLLGRAR